MKVTVHQAMCVASGNCGLVAPRVFQNRQENGGFVELLQADPDGADLEAAQEAEYLCPSGTIQVGKHRIPARKSGDGIPGKAP
ncbi:ferredoxin [Glutamicibacter sp.]|uniref:ferredoxin n=1 Tax=Glutamicibacter sp. TaxID=1931995 RepID=UPI003D6B92B6